jgi:hypothetical protein
MHNLRIFLCVCALIFFFMDFLCGDFVGIQSVIGHFLVNYRNFGQIRGNKALKVIRALPF